MGPHSRRHRLRRATHTPRRFARCFPCRLPPPHVTAPTARYRLRVAGELLLVAEWGNSRVSVFERESLRFLRHIGATLDEDGDQRVSWGEFRGAVLGATPWGAE